MRILAVSDEENRGLWDHFTPDKLDGIDLIISCGDLKAEYLSFLVTMGHVPVLYVHGNHDEGYKKYPPEGCDCIDDHLVVYNGVRILGLGGCRWYHPGDFQYTEAQMRRRIAHVRYALWKAGGVDLVVTHAPPRGLGDGRDNAHIGFDALLPLMDRYHPAYLLHGHMHQNYDPHYQREHQYGETHIINVSDRYILDFPEKDFDPREKGQLVYKTRQKKDRDDLYFSIANEKPLD